MSIDCDRMREDMSGLLDGQLEPAQTRLLQAHVDGCLPCRAGLDAMRSVDRLLSAAPMLTPTSGFTGRFEARLAARRNRRRTLIGLILLSLTTLALVLSGVGLLTAWSLLVWQGSDVSFPGLFQGVTQILARAAEAAEGLMDMVQVVLRAIGRVRSHQVYLSGVVMTALLAVAWAWAVGLRPRALRPVRAA